MAHIKFDKLFKLEILHSYYTSGKSSDFTIIPTPETQRLLNKYRLRLLNIDTGIIVFQKKNPEVNGTPMFPLPSQFQRFSFRLVLNSSAFGNITTLPAKDATEKYYYTNLNGSNEITPVNDITELNGANPKEITPSVFNHEFTITAGSAPQVTIQIFDSANQQIGGNKTISSYASSGNTHSYKFPVDLRAYPAGFYTIKHGATYQSLDKTILVDDYMSSSSTFGVIDIYRDDNDPKDYVIDYDVQDNTWDYYVVLKNGPGIGVYDIDDNSNSPYSSENFQLFTPPTSQPYTHERKKIIFLEEKYGSGKVLLFRASSPFYEKPKTGLSFKKTLPTSQTYMTNLPNPVFSAKPEVVLVIDN